MNPEQFGRSKRLTCRNWNVFYAESQHQSQSNEKSLVQFDYEKAVSNYWGTQSTFNPCSSHPRRLRVPFIYAPPPVPHATHRPLGRSGPSLKPGTVCVCGVNGLRRGMHTTQHPPSPASRTGAGLPTNVQAVLWAVSHVNTHRPRFHVRARPS